MKLKDLASKPKLIPVVLDDEDTVASYGESLEFYTYDRQPIQTFMKLASTQGTDNEAMLELVRTMVLDEEGKEILNDEVSIPGPVLMRAISKIVATLGK
jgi:hypothetical protein